MTDSLIGVDAAIARIRAFATSKGWRKSRLAAEAGMSDTTLRNFDDPCWSPTADTLRRLEAIIPVDFGRQPPEPATAAE